MRSHEIDASQANFIEFHFNWLVLAYFTNFTNIWCGHEHVTVACHEDVGRSAMPQCRSLRRARRVLCHCPCRHCLLGIPMLRCRRSVQPVALTCQRSSTKFNEVQRSSTKFNEDDKMIIISNIFLYIIWNVYNILSSPYDHPLPPLAVTVCCLICTYL